MKGPVPRFSGDTSKEMKGAHFGSMYTKKEMKEYQDFIKLLFLFILRLTTLKEKE